MKTFKRMIVLMLTLMMCLTMGGLSVFAADYDSPLTVTGLAAGDTVKFYKVVEWVGEAEGNVAGWKAVSPYDSVLTKDKLTEILVGTKADPEAEPPVAAKDPTGITSEVAGELAKLATGGEDGIVEGTTATLNNTSAGLWMALVTPADANTIYNPVFVGADYNKEAGGTVAMSATYNGDAVAKSSTLKLEKKADTAPEDDWDDNQSHTTAVGDTVKFEVTTNIPAYGDVYTNPHFVLTDKLTAMELKADSDNPCGYDITIEGVPATYKDADNNDQSSYTIAPAADKKSYTITFAEGYLKTLKAAVTDVKVKYSAIVTTDAEKAVSEEDNEVSIEYSHNPNQQNDYDVKKDTTQHYTFTLDASGIAEGEHETLAGKKTSELVKVGVDAKGDPITETTYTSDIGDPTVDKWTGPLEGAVFGLFTDSACTEPYKAKKADGTAGTTAMTATTGSDGRMTFKGLDAGKYYLKELSAPAGFVTNSDPVEVVITATTKKVTVTEWYKDGAWSSTDNGGKKVTYDTDILESYTVTVGGKTAAEYKFKNADTASSTDINWEEAELVEHPFPFTNVKGTELPSTGGIGTIIFYVLGTILVVGSAIILISRRRIQSR